MKFRNKILLAIWSVVLVLLLITSVIIKYWTRVQVETRFSEDLRSNYTTLRELSGLRMDEITKTSELIAETPRLKAVAELGDPNTALQLSHELNQSILGDLFLLTDARGRTLVWLTENNEVKVPSAASARTLQGRSGTDVRSLDGAIYRCATAPVIIASDVLGSLTLGFRIGKDDLEATKSMTNSEIVLTLADTILNSTLVPEAETALGAWLLTHHLAQTTTDSAAATASIITVNTSLENYLATSVLLNRSQAREPEPIRFLLLKPVEQEVQAALRPVFETFIILSVIVLLVTAVIGFLISQGITRPIAALVRGTTEISQGNYDYAIAVGRDAELRYLAGKFTEMSRALKDKMHQLAERNTELEEALQQLKAMQMELVRSERLAATGKLTAQLAHEINNPVHNIQSCLQTLLRRMNTLSTDSKDRELLDLALEEITRLARLTHQMLDVYRTSLVPLERKPVSLNDVIRDVANSSAETFRRQQVTLKLLLFPELPLIEGSNDKLKQVFLNLFINAVDAMPTGGTLAIQTVKQNGNIVVDVADSGVGIPPENIHRIFDAFFTTKSKVTGVGLGLSVTYGIVRQHDGSISVKSRAGEGATFRLTFPVKST